jgi:hypothetical protein
MKVSHVDFYSGSKGEEFPKKIYTPSEIIIVEAIIETKLEEDFYSKERKKVFIFRSSEKDFYQLKAGRESYELKKIKGKGKDK